MNKNELVTAIAAETEQTEKTVKATIEKFIEIVTGELKKGEKVQMTGFGTFMTRQRAARNGRDPRTGKKLKIEASIVPAFKTGKTLREAINVKPAKKGKKK